MTAQILTQAQLKEYCVYDHNTGNFSRLSTPNKVAGSQDTHGYRQIKINKKLYLAHRLAWLYVHGSWPSKPLDHINGNRSDNRIENLREASVGQNNQNIKQARKDSQTGLVGISRRGNRFIARIWHKGQRICLGHHATAEEAHAAYIEAKRQYHKFCTI